MFSQNASEVGYKRTLNESSPVYKSSGHYQSHTLRMEQGMVWINGNLCKDEDVPESLKNPNMSIQITLFGSDEFGFSMFGRDYLLKHGKIIEIEAPIHSTSDFTPLSKDDYFSTMRNETPDLFSSWRREAELQELCTRLTLDYDVATDPEKAIIAPQLRIALEELFDIIIQNQLQEIYQVETEIESLKKEVSFRQKNKELVIQNQMKKLLGTE